MTEQQHLESVQPAIDLRDRWASALMGVAYGDSWGDLHEFARYPAIVNATRPRGPEAPDKMRITDDTQMTLSLARALDGAGHRSPRSLRASIADEWAIWHGDSDNNRAPGGSCMAACGAYRRGLDWPEAMVTESTGCGTVMRNASTAFLPDRLQLPVSAYAAASTHGAASAVISAVVMTVVMREAATGVIHQGELSARAYELLSDEKGLTTLDGAMSWIAAGHPHIATTSRNIVRMYVDMGVRALIKPVEYALRAQSTGPLHKDPWSSDLCIYTGQGWNAHTCLATALLAADLFPDDPIEALRRGVCTGGDSDSIGAVTGALVGACHTDPWPDEWLARLEPRYRGWILDAIDYDLGGME